MEHGSRGVILNRTTKFLEEEPTNPIKRLRYEYKNANAAKFRVAHWSPIIGQTELAEVLGTSQATINKLEKNTVQSISGSILLALYENKYASKKKLIEIMIYFQKLRSRK